MLQSVISVEISNNVTINMRSAGRGRMINRLKRGSTVLLNQTVWRQTEVCISISAVGSSDVDKIKTLFKETGCQDVYWVELVEGCEHRGWTFLFVLLLLCPVELFSTPADCTHILYITLRLVMTYLNIIAGIQRHHRPSSYCRLMPVGIL